MCVLLLTARVVPGKTSNVEFASLPMVFVLSLLQTVSATKELLERAHNMSVYATEYVFQTGNSFIGCKLEPHEFYSCLKSCTVHSKWDHIDALYNMDEHNLSGSNSNLEYRVPECLQCWSYWRQILHMVQRCTCK